MSMLGGEGSGSRRFRSGIRFRAASLGIPIRSEGMDTLFAIGSATV